MKCRICGDDCSYLARLKKQPLANKYPVDQEAIAKEKFWNLDALICSNCYAGQLSEILSRDELFQDYYYLSSVNTELVEHFNDLASKLHESKFVLDIGSNDGVLLRPLKERGIKCLGIDPSVNVGSLANEEGLETIIGFFDANSAKEIVKNYEKPDVIVASSIFTHLEDPKSFVRNLQEVLSEDGIIIIEIEYLLNMIKQFQFERFYFDRVFYYSITSLNYLFSENGFKLYDIEDIDPHGGSLRVYIARENSKNEVSETLLKFLKNEEKSLRSDQITKFQNAIENYANDFVEALKDYSQKGLRVCGFGSPARLATITNFADIGPDLIEYVVDDSPLKCGRYSPGKSIPIKDRSHMEDNPPDVIVVFAYEYFDSIYKFTSRFGVDHYQPIPFKKLEVTK